ncbi:MAG: hydroxymethylpyrimidine transporter substrate-binding protein [Acidobacteria bacterium]|nr:hydroxymethylpyrimidine transporter substrate-binding protein [Acidobacteriota bacterium]
MRRSVVAVLIVAPLLAGAAPAVPAALPVPVTVQLNWLPEPEFGGIYAALEGGLFAAAGLDVTILKGGPDVPAVPMTASGRVTFGVAAADEVVSLRAKGADIVAVFATYQTSPQAIMVRADRPVDGIPALLAQGGTLIAQPGLAYLKHLKRAYGLERTRIVPYGSGALAQFLDPKRSDVAMQCFVFAEPIVARARGVESKVFLIADTGFDPYAAVIVVRGDWLRANRELVARFVGALREGWNRYLRDPGLTNAVMARLNTAMDLSTFAAAARAQEPLIAGGDAAARGLGVMTEARWAKLAGQLLELDVVDRPVPAADCFVNP